MDRRSRNFRRDKNGNLVFFLGVSKTGAGADTAVGYLIKNENQRQMAEALFRADKGAMLIATFAVVMALAPFALVPVHLGFARFFSGHILTTSAIFMFPVVPLAMWHVERRQREIKSLPKFQGKYSDTSPASFGR